MNPFRRGKKCKTRTNSSTINPDLERGTRPSATTMFPAPTQSSPFPSSDGGMSSNQNGAVAYSEEIEMTNGRDDVPRQGQSSEETAVDLTIVDAPNEEPKPRNRFLSKFRI